MNLNLHVIAGELAALDFSLHGKPSVTHLDCPLPRLLEKGAPVREGACYVCDGRDLPSDAADARFICRGKPSDAVFNEGRRFVWTEREIPLVELFNLVLDVYEDYETWMKELQRLADGVCTPHEFGRAVQKRFGNPTMCFSATYRCIFHVPGDLSAASPDTLENYLRIFNGAVPYPENQVLLPQSINLVQSDKRFTNALVKRGPVKAGHDLLLFDSASQALFIDGKPAAWVIVNGVSRPLDKRDESALHMIAGYATNLLTAWQSNSLEGYSNAEAIMMDMLERRNPLDERRIAEALQSLGWDIEDEYVCLLSDVTSRNPLPAMLRSMAKIIERHVPASLSVVFKGKVVIAANLSRAALSRKLLVDALISVVDDNAASICVSRVFDDFNDLHYYYRQCESIGKADVAGQGTVRVYDDYAVEQGLQAVRQDGLPLETRYPEGLRLLLKHDRKKGSDLAGLLRAYLECDRSVVKTMRRTYISKSTCIYRLNLMNEISQLDLDDPAVRFELLAVFALMDLDDERTG